MYEPGGSDYGSVGLTSEVGMKNSQEGERSKLVNSEGGTEQESFSKVRSSILKEYHRSPKTWISVVVTACAVCICISLVLVVVLIIILTLGAGASDRALYKKEYQQFLNEYDNAKEYGYPSSNYRTRHIDWLRSKQTPYMNDESYFDYNAAGLYTKRMLEAVSSTFESEIYGTAGFPSPSAVTTSEAIAESRRSILKYFNAPSDEYMVIFTMSTTHSCKLLSSWFPWGRGSKFYYTVENHESVLGIREDVARFGFQSEAIEESKVLETLTSTSFANATLFAYPAQSNFAGRMFNLSWINQLSEIENLYVFLDAAAFLGTNKLDLSAHPFDMVALSFYKLYGFVSGLGCLVVKKSVAEMFQKHYFGSGTVQYASANDSRRIEISNIPERFEDGAPNFQAIVLARSGLQEFSDLGIDRINNHMHACCKYTYLRLLDMKHSNGNPVVKIYGNHHLHRRDVQGGIVSFNVLDPDGSYIGPKEVIKRAAENHIHIRGGIHSNPGGALRELDLTFDTYREWFDSHSDVDVYKGIPIGSVRVSFGYLTNFRDIFNLFQFMQNYYQH